MLGIAAFADYTKRQAPSRLEQRLSREKIIFQDNRQDKYAAIIAGTNTMPEKPAVFVASSGAYESAEIYNDTILSFGAGVLCACESKEDSDRNKDGKVSVLEAFDFGKQNHTGALLKRQTPEIGSSILDPNEVFISDYSYDQN
jgi:hypothetical protein